MGFEEKIKLEPPDDYEPEAKETDPLRDHDYCKNPKLEELMEPKLEEPDYFEMDRPSEKSLESPIFEYPEYLKLESVDDYGSEAAEPTQAQTTNPIEPTNVYSLKKREVVQANTARLDTRKCSVCSIITERKNLVSTKLNNRKFIVLLGAVLGGQMSIPSAKTSLSVGSIMFCPNHFTEAVDEIFKVLQISYVFEMKSCSIDKREALMTTVVSLNSTLDFEQLIQAVHEHVRAVDTLRQPHQNIGRKRKTSSTKVKPVSHKCCMCPLISNNQSLAFITSPKRKVVLMVGAVLSGKKSIEEARSLVSKWECHICEHHLSEVIDSIFAALNVTNAKCIREMQLCSMDNQKQVMSIVSSLSTAFSFAEFTKLLSIFVQKLYYMRGTVRTNTLHC